MTKELEECEELAAKLNKDAEADTGVLYDALDRIRKKTEYEETHNLFEKQFGLRIKKLCEETDREEQEAS